jgi:thioredoxin 1
MWDKTLYNGITKRCAALPQKKYKEINKMSALKINKEEFEKIRNSEGVVLLDFYADWCGPCRMVSPIIEEIAKERSDIKVGKINVDEERDLASEFSVYSIPTLVVLKDGEVINRAQGARPKAAILSLIDG